MQKTSSENFIMNLLISSYRSFINIIYCLYESTRSIKFYQNVYSKFTGYGFRYTLLVSIFSALFCTISLLGYAKSVSEFLLGEKSGVSNIEYILNQIPNIKYDGYNISIDNESPIIIKDINDQNIIFINPMNAKLPTSNSSVVIFMSQNKMTVSIKDKQNSGTQISETSFDYHTIFGKGEFVIDKKFVKTMIDNYSRRYSKILSYIVFPILILVLFAYNIIGEITTICIFYVALNMLVLKSSLKICCRLALYSGSIAFLLNPILLLIFPQFAKFTFLLKLWTNFLVILAVSRLRNNNKNKSSQN